MRSGLGKQKMQDYENTMDDWDNFIEDTQEYYGVNMKILTDPFREEQEKYYLKVKFFLSGIEQTFPTNTHTILIYTV